MTATSPARVVGAPTSLWNPSHGAALLAAGMAPRALRAAVMAFTSLDDYLGAPNDRLQAAGVPRIAPAEWRCPPEAFVVLVGHPGYPTWLAARPSPPPVLVGVGDASALVNDRGVAVVGSRSMTAMGRAAVDAAIEGATRCAATVVSGMAAGVDAAAHTAALGAGLVTVGVAGSSLDALDRRTQQVAGDIIAAGGAVVSHLVGPQAPMSARHLHTRNHVIAHLAGVMVPCEGRIASGTASAVRAALAARSTLVVPYPRAPFRDAANVELLVELCDPLPALQRLGITGALAERVRRRRPLADAVAEDRESLAVLVDAAVRVRAAGFV